MSYVLYSTLLTCAAPAGAGWLLLKPRHRPLLRRFAPKVPQGLSRPVWVQACSVGEVSLAKSFIAHLRARHPEWPVLLTVSTISGMAHAKASRAAEAITWFPFDHPLSVDAFLRRAQPRALVLVETEIWPNVIRGMRRTGAPVIVVNGRISDRHFERYRRYRRFLAPVFAQVTAVGAQNDRYAQRLAELGVEPNRIAVTGTMKFDGVCAEISDEQKSRVRAENGFREDDPILVFGSTRAGEDALAVRCWSQLREIHPRLRLVLAPRHPDAMDALSPADTGPVERRSAIKAGTPPQGVGVFVVDTLGELTQFYSVATVAVVGGGLYPGIGGHNPLEPAALAVPTVVGPHMEGFADATEALVSAGGAVQVSAPDALCGALARLLDDSAARAVLGRNGRAVVLANRGAVARNVDVLDTALAESD